MRPTFRSFAWAKTYFSLLENCVLLGSYTASSGNFLPTFRYNLPVSFSRVKNPKHSRFCNREECERCKVFSSVVSANRVNVSVEEGGEGQELSERGRRLED